MARGTWTIYKKVGTVWTPDGSLYRPNDDFSLQKVSTQKRVPLVDGSKAFVTTSTYYVNQPLVFQWYYEDGTTKTKVENYINNQNDLKIVDQNGDTYIGRFTSSEASLFVGVSPDVYDLKATFERMPDISASSSSSSSSSSSFSSSSSSSIGV